MSCVIRHVQIHLLFFLLRAQSMYIELSHHLCTSELCRVPVPMHLMYASLWAVVAAISSLNGCC